MIMIENTLIKHEANYRKKGREREYKSPTQGKNKVLILYAIYIKILIMKYWELLPMNLTM